MSVKQQDPPLWHLRDSVVKLDMDTHCLESKRVVNRDPAQKGNSGIKSSNSKTSVATSCTFPDTITIDSSKKDYGAFEHQNSCDAMDIDCDDRVRRNQKLFEGGRDLQSRLLARSLLHTAVNDQLVGSNTSTSIVSSSIQHSKTSLGCSTRNRRASLDSLLNTCSGSLSGAILNVSPSSKDDACPRARSLSYSSSDLVSSVSCESIPVKNVNVVEIQKKHEPAVAPPIHTVEEPRHVSKKWNKSSKEVTFSIKEIRKCVVESIPESVQQQIHPGAWDRILNEADSMYPDNFAATSPRRLVEDEASDLISVISGMIDKEADQDEGQHSVFSDITGGFSSSLDGRHLSEIVATPNTSIRHPSNTKTPKIVPTTIDEAEVLGSLAPHAPGEVVPRVLSFCKLNAKEEEKEKPSVKFHAVHVRYYERILSDNPAVTAGPSVGLGWRYKHAPQTYHIDEWEDMQGCTRRSLEQLILPRYERTTMVIELGYSHKQIADVIRKSLRIKHNRMVTFNNLSYQKMEEFMEMTTRRLKKVVTLGFMTRDKKLKY